MSETGPLRLLLLEDDPRDEELLRHELEKGGAAFELRRVETADSFRKGLADWKPDAVLADYRMGGFTALDVLGDARRADPDLPFILVTGSLGEEGAVEALRRGATDYILKDRPARLGEAVRNAVQAAADRRAAREALDLNRQIILSSSVGITVYDRDLRYLVWNPVMEKLTGLPASEMIGRHPLELLPVLRENGLYALMERALGGEIVQADDVQSTRPGAEPVWTSPRFGPLRDGRGAIMGVIGMVRDVTARRRAEEEVVRTLDRERSARAEIQEILGRVSDGFVSLDLDWRYTFLNRAGALMVGRPAEELIGKHIWTEFPEETVQRFRLAYERAMREQKPSMLEEYYAPYDKWFENRIYPSPTGLSIFFSDVTERRKAEETQNRLAMILEGTSDFVGFSDAAGNALYVNAAGRRMVGLGERAPLPPRIADYHAERLTRAYVEEYLPAAVRDGVWRGESAFLARDGREIPVSQVIVAHRNERGEVERFSTIARDITSEKRAEAELRGSEERFREIAENIREVFWVVTPDLSKTLYLSPAFETLFGRRREQVYRDPLTWAEAIHPDDRQRAVETVQREASRGSYQQTYRVLRPDGTVRWVHDRAFGVRDASGQLARIVGLAEDITELKSVEEELRRLNRTLEEKVRERTGALHESEATLDMIFNSQSTFVALTSRDGRLVRINQAPLQAAGLTWKEVSDLPAWDTPWWNYAEESRRRLREDLGRAVAGEVVTGEYRISAGGGRFMLIEASFRAVRNAEGQVTHVLGEALDVTARREAEAALAESERKFRSLVENLPGAVYRADYSPPWRLAYVSDVVHSLSGYPAVEFTERGRTWESLILPEDLAPVRDEIAEKVRRGESHPVEFRIVRADGAVRWILASGRPVRDAQGATLYCEGVFYDVTERREAQAALEASERKFRSLVSTVPGVVYRCETRAPWRMQFISEAVLDLTGYPTSDFMERGRTWVSIMVPEDVPLVTAVAGEAERMGKPGMVEYRIRRADGTIRWVLESGQVVKPSADGPPYVEGVILDITSRKIAEAALEKSEEERIRLEELTRVRSRFEGIVGKSAPMQEVYRRLRLAAQSDVTVLLTGESGTGKELAAAAIHALSARKGKPFVAVNCSAIPETLLESELFGHAKGSFTGAVRDKVGLFQAADGGTLFLDEVGDMPAALQVKVLRALQEREVRRVGDEKSARVDVRIVAATNRDLAALIAEGTIREDFYYRIRVFEIALPPLRERKDDVPILVAQFLDDLSKSHRKTVKGLTADALRRLMEYSWPGNVRELRNVLEHALVTVSGDRIAEEDLPSVVRSPSAPPPLPQDSPERRRILEALKQAGGNRETAAKLLGISRVTLWKRIRKMGIKVEER